MADLQLRREHSLGLARARQVAREWAEDMRGKLEMECTLVEGDASEVVEFARAGVDGRLVAAADFFEFEATLGFMLRPFKAQIESEAARRLDAALAKAQAAA